VDGDRCWGAVQSRDARSDLVRRAERWAPWRASAVQHLWATGEHTVHRLPEEAA